jgi:hypothetical protein
MAAVGLRATRVARAQGSGKARERDARDLYEIANLYPRETGLPMTVWVSPRGRARHSARIKVCRVPGDRMVPTDTASVRILPRPTLVEGELPAGYLDKVVTWIAANREVLLDYWNGAIGTSEMASRLRRI